MDLNGIRSELRRLTELTAEWQARGGADELERDVALGMLRRIYEAIRFQESVPEAARPTESAVEVPVTLDLDGILDPSAAVSDAEPLAEPQVAAAGAAAPGLSGAEEMPEPALPEPQAAAEGVSGTEREETAAETEIRVSDGGEASDAAAPAGCEAAVAAEAVVPPVVSAVDAVFAEPDETERTQEAEAPGGAADGAEQPRPAAPEKGNVIEPALFGLDEIVQHKRKQRVIMSLYDDAPNRRKNAAPERGSRPEKPVGRPAAEVVPVPEISIDDSDLRADVDGPAVLSGAEDAARPEAADAGLGAAAEPSSQAPRAAGDAADPAPAGTVLGEVINRDVQTLAETLAPPRNAVADIAQRTPVEDLRAAIGINDKFLLVRDLFDGDAEAGDRAIDALNGFDDLDECMIHIAEHYAWNPNSDGAKLLMELLERKLA